jgi:hypothetical protein
MRKYEKNQISKSYTAIANIFLPFVILFKKSTDKLSSFEYRIIFFEKNPYRDTKSQKEDEEEGEVKKLLSS